MLFRSAADTASSMLPTMLGGSAPQRYLLVFQNNAEIRATGGLPGAVADVVASDGRLSIEKQIAGMDLGPTRRPVLPLTDAERKLYGDVLGQYFVNANSTPDVPRAADLMRARWEQAYPDRPVDGVILVDTVALGYLIDATGPITVQGVRLTGENLTEELLSRSYARLTQDQQDAFFAEVARTAFEKFTTGVSDGTALLKALAHGVEEGRILLHSFDADLQQRITGTRIAGDLLSAPPASRPSIAVTLDDTTAAKMSYYLRYQVDASATYCTPQQGQGISLKAHLTSTAPADAATSLPSYVTGNQGVRKGDELVTVRFFGPVGGSIGDLVLNDEPMSLIRTTEDGRPVAMTYIELMPGQTVDLSLTMESGPDQAGDTQVTVTPTIQRSDVLSTLTSACG